MTARRASPRAAPSVPERAGRRPTPRAPEPPAPPRVLSIHAHPDDQEFTVAGTLAKWARAGSTIVTVCVPSGGAGSNQYTPPGMTREARVPIREAEQRAACRVPARPTSRARSSPSGARSRLATWWPGSRHSGRRDEAADGRRT